MEKVPTINAFTRQDLRKWLAKHHLTEKRVAVIIHKRHTGKPFPTHRELIEEAICFGWIDTTIKRINEDTFIRHFSKRNPKGKWSYNTLSYAEALLKAGKMSPAGLHAYELGSSRPTHDHGIPSHPKMPPELKEALAKNKKAETNFSAYSPSAKRMLYRWYLHAKLPATKTKRLQQIVGWAVKNNKNFFNPTQKTNS